MYLEYWIDITDASGVKQGDGPITSALNWTHTANLDRAGTFSFSMPCDDPRRDLLRIKRLAYCWTVAADGPKFLGGGIINDVSTSLSADGRAVLTVSGDDLLHELTYRTVGDLFLRETVESHPAEAFYCPDAPILSTGDDVTDRVWLDYLTDYELGDTTSYHEFDDNNEARYFIFKYPRPFHKLTLTFTVPNDQTAGYDFFYWATDGSWESLTATASGGVPFGGATYTLEWDAPTDWVIRSGEAGYKVAYRPLACKTGVRMSDAYVTCYRPTDDALGPVMALAPTGWSLDTAHGYDSITAATETGVNLVQNGGLETHGGTADDGTSDTFTSWTVAGTNDGAGDKVEATATAYAGSKAVKITNTSAYATPRLYQDITVDEATDYILTLAGRGDGTHAGVYLVGINGGVTHALTPFTSSEQTAASYAVVTQEITVPAGVTALRLQLYGPWYLESGTAYWDALSLRQRLGGEVYHEFANESVLEALIRVAEQTGEHFILSPSGRQVLWLRNDVRSAGVRCVGNVDPQAAEDRADLALIVDLQEQQTAYELVSRVYPYGGGSGAERVTLANCTRSAPDGYTLDKTNNYLCRTQSETAYGRIDRRLDLSDIVAADQSAAQLQYAANQLFDRAYVYLRRHSAINTDLTSGDVPRTYNLTLAKCDRVLLPGYTVRVEYDRWINYTRQYSLNADLWILSATVNVTDRGIETVALQCSTMDTLPVTDASLLADVIRKQRQMAAHAPG